MTSRRQWLHLSAGLAWLSRTPLRAAPIAATPACDDDATPRATEGPFWTPDSPERSLLREPATVGTPLRIEARVTDLRCRPLAGAVVDVWSCDGNGDYDNHGYRLRGHQYTDADGRIVFDTVRPAAYGSGGFRRTPHVHVKLRAGSARVLTTQLYFPGEAQNARDGMFDERLLVELEPDGALARFTFVLDVPESGGAA
jgi:protocatechuate 3,4-dioxygenase beta subunit